MDNPVRILLLDDHALFREGLARLLDSEPGLSVAGQSSTVSKALALIAVKPVDLILLDYDLGDELGTNILASLAALQSAPRILIVTAGMTPKSMREAVAAGAVGVVLKHSGAKSLINAIRNAVCEGGVEKRRVILPSVLPRSGRLRLTSLQERPLTLRQSKALHAILNGLGNREMASELHMSESSVKAVIQELFDKAGVCTRSQLVRVAIEKHLSDWIRKNTSSRCYRRVTMTTDERHSEFDGTRICVVPDDLVLVPTRCANYVPFQGDQEEIHTQAFFVGDTRSLTCP